MTLAFWAVEHFLVIFHQICIKYTKSIWFSALKWGTVHLCAYLEIKDTGKNVKKCFFQFHHFCKKKFVKIMHHTLHHFCMNFLAKACLFLQKFKIYLKVRFQSFLRRYTTLFLVNWPRNGQCSNFKVKEIDQNMVASMFNNLKAKIYSESKNGYTSEISWILCKWSFRNPMFRKIQ